VDVEITVEGIVSPFNDLLEAGDFEGAEAHLSASLGLHPYLHALLHFQFGRLYIRWNKLSSAVSHLGTAAEAAHASNDFILLSIIQTELKLARQNQLGQKP
jgi:predicted negative regulator of RcsB-dependent stress response